MKGEALGLVLVAFLAIIISLLMMEGVSGSEIVSFNEWPEEHLVIYEGQECVVEYTAVTSYRMWNLSFGGPLFDDMPWLHWHYEDIDVNTSGIITFPLYPSVDPGGYEMSLLMERTHPDGKVETETLTIPVTFWRAVEVDELSLVRGTSGLTLTLMVTTHVPIESLWVTTYVSGGFETVPGVFEVTELEPGTYTYISEVEPTSTTALSPSLMGYRLEVAIDDTHYIDLEDEIEEPDVRESARDYLLLFVPLLVAFLVLGTVVVLYHKRQQHGESEGRSRGRREAV